MPRRESDGLRTLVAGAIIIALNFAIERATMDVQHDYYNGFPDGVTEGKVQPLGFSELGRSHVIILCDPAGGVLVT
jgi:hypothetical protein